MVVGQVVWFRLMVKSEINFFVPIRQGKERPTLSSGVDEGRVFRNGSS